MFSKGYCRRKILKVARSRTLLNGRNRAGGCAVRGDDGGSWHWCERLDSLALVSMGTSIFYYDSPCVKYGKTLDSIARQLEGEGRARGGVHQRAKHDIKLRGWS